MCLQPAGPLVAKCRTLDQARALVTFLDAASEKTLRATVALTASRGRGKVGLSPCDEGLICGQHPASIVADVVAPTPYSIFH